MRILEISFEEPSDFSGGGIGIKQSLLSLAKLGRVDYIGPSFDMDLFSDEKNINIIKELYDVGVETINKFAPIPIVP